MLSHFTGEETKCTEKGLAQITKLGIGGEATFKTQVVIKSVNLKDLTAEVRPLVFPQLRCGKH